jgi:hypothetical protein
MKKEEIWRMRGSDRGRESIRKGILQVKDKAIWNEQEKDKDR